MIGFLLYWLFGYRWVRLSAQHVSAALNLLRDGGYPHGRIRREEDDAHSFRMSSRTAAVYGAACAAAGLGVEIGKPCGLPAQLQRWRARWGLAVGALLLAALLWLSTQVVWRIEIMGNTVYTDSEILSALKSVGFEIGTPFRGIDFDLLQNRVLLENRELAWIAVNMRGTCATVEVREKRSVKKHTSAGYANIVAAEDGQIVEVRVSGGQAEVQIGDVVRAGELLISGVIAVGESGVRFEYADGEVLARVNRTVIGEAAAIGEEKQYGESVCLEKSLIFFGKEIKFFRKSGIEGVTYDTIILDTPITLPDGTPLPISFRTVEARPYTVAERQYSEDDMAAEAERQYRAALAALLSEAELLSLTVERRAENGIFRVTGSAVCICDIARTSEISVRESAGE